LFLLLGDAGGGKRRETMTKRIKIPGTYNGNEMAIEVAADHASVRVFGPASCNDVKAALAPLGLTVTYSTWNGGGEELDDGSWVYTALGLPTDSEE
jgi:hypothetical protein